MRFKARVAADLPTICMSNCLGLQPDVLSLSSMLLLDKFPLDDMATGV